MKKPEHKRYEVKVRLPGTSATTLEVSAADNLDAKSQASKQLYGHVFTGQFRYMAARVKKEQ